MSDDPKIVWNEPNFHHAFQAWDGMTGTWTREKADELEILARVSAGYDTGALFESIGVSTGHNERTGDLEAKVGANADAVTPQVGYAVWHHEGTLPHEIRPRQPSGVLRFGRGGMVVFARHVWHPGTQPVKYLTRWLRGLF